MLNPKQFEEVQFWRQLVKEEGTQKFLQRRRADFYRHMNNFEGHADLSGDGIEIGTGCFSQLEWANSRSIVGVDPLVTEYSLILPIRNTLVSMRELDGENLPESFTNQFDWAVCWNVIDHTPNSVKMVQEMYRVVKHGGYIYLEVNFDDALQLPHYGLWVEETVDFHFPIIDQKYKNIIRNDKDKQSLFYAVYQKI